MKNTKNTKNAKNAKKEHLTTNLEHKTSFNPLGIPLLRIKTGYPTSQAIKKHPDLIPFLKSQNPPRIDNENRELLLLYNRYIAQDLFQLDIEFSPNAIIPTPVMRYNFLKHVINYKKTNEPSSREKNKLEHSLLEIGTGASAIIAMLAAKHFNCNVFATEIDSEYFKIAKKNIQKNKLGKKIKLFLSKGGIINSVIPKDLKVDYIVSNPPYYDKILSPKVIWGGKNHELVSKGNAGECFILQMIQEGWSHLNPGGIIAFIIPKTRTETIIEIENYLNKKNFDYEIIGLLVGNRTRYIFRVFKEEYKIDFNPLSEMLD
ncbi:RlmF-related methyltransferase [Candidatus Harpocratesius sp.]